MVLFFAIQPLSGMEYLGSFIKKMQKNMLEKIQRQFEKPTIEFEKPITITTTPLASGTLKKETESVIQQINFVLNLYNVNPENIQNCSVVVSAETYQDEVLDLFKRKKFSPKKIKVKVLNLKDIKIAVDITIFNNRKKKDRLTDTPKKAKL